MRILFICLLTLLTTIPLLAGETEVIRLSEAVETTETYEAFGAPLPDSGQALALGDLIERSEQFLDQEVLVNTRIAKVCQKKGCFFVAHDGAATARITFKDYGFFIPTDSGGKLATLYGTFSRKEVSAEEAEHFAEDLGEEASLPPEAYEYSLVASGVKIFKS